MTRWRRSTGDEHCGAMPIGECVIPRGEPLQEIWPGVAFERPGMRPLKRCVTHALGPAPADLPPLEDPAPFVSEPSAAVRRPLRRLTREEIASLPFDAKAAAAGRDD